VKKHEALPGGIGGELRTGGRTAGSAVDCSLMAAQRHAINGMDVILPQEVRSLEVRALIGLEHDQFRWSVADG
jgi:hypothetical protein